MLFQVLHYLQCILVNTPASLGGGVTALQGAVKKCNLELTKGLLDLGADSNAPGAAIGEKTAVEITSFASNSKMLQMLLERGARFQPYWNVLPLDLEDSSPLFADGRFLSWKYRYPPCSPEHYDRKCACAMRCDKSMNLISLVVKNGIDITLFPPVFIKNGLTNRHTNGNSSRY